MDLLKSIILNNEKVSGQPVSLAKSSVFFSKNVLEADKGELVALLLISFFMGKGSI